ncbi:MAG TPA: FliM/FliN family flagellar motor switch protein [Candidatus Dormibacteraeota bacterium]|nr:FliM/FliN family flagellar motor switch protein [Candidatus Dormibacteraeota bacterium]
MKYLAFAGAQRVCAARFEERSIVSVSAACVVANAMRERIGALCGSEVDLRLWPPAIPRADAWNAILRDAHVYVARGTLADAAIVLRAAEARALAALLFGEMPRDAPQGALSRIEAEITRRAIAAIVPTLAPVCGETQLDESSQAIDAATYFELHLVAPAPLCIGIALSREPLPTTTKRIDAALVRKARIDARAELRLAAIAAEAVAALRPGDVLVARSAQCVLRANGAVCARGTCGVRLRRYAFRVHRRA